MDSSTLHKKLDQVFHADYFQLKRKLAQVKSSKNEKRLSALMDSVQASITRREYFESVALHCDLPSELPVSEKKDDIITAIQKNQVVIVCGETGSGKTTQLPKLAWLAGCGRQGRIGHTQPRRLAAQSVAKRIAEEMQVSLGNEVGFQVRFQQQFDDRSIIKVMTDGILLAELQNDRWLNQYDTLIIDEAHERSLNIDFLLGYCQQLLAKRPEFKLIITSATINAEQMASFFNDAPVIDVSGRSYPIDILYQSLQRDEGEDLSLYQGIDLALQDICELGKGDVLVFLPGERHIREASRLLRDWRERADLLPLYSRLPAKEQQKIFRTGPKRRIILSTNVAETSLTVPGIRYVIDAGLARLSRYSWRAKVQRLPIEKISQASANQRAGRCGRVGPGVCIRLYDEDDYLARPAFTDPEILRTSLAQVILQMKTLRLGEIENFPLLDAPDRRLINDGYHLLQMLKSLDANKNITQLGKQLSRLPLDPQLAAMLLAAKTQGVAQAALVIVTALTVQDPREYPMEHRELAKQAHAKFRHKTSDFMSILAVWDYCQQQKSELSQSAFRKLCVKEFISYRRWREWHELYRQIRKQLVAEKWKLDNVTEEPDYAQLHRAILAGYPDNIGLFDQKEYQGCRQRRFHVFPTSGINLKGCKWILAAEISETQRLYARTVAKIEPEWVEDICSHLLKWSYSEPHWQQKTARVAAYAKATLFGLVVRERKRVNFTSIDPVQSRELFIMHALVQGEFRHSAGVLKYNKSALQRVNKLEQKLRRRDLRASDDVLYEFFDQHIPAHVCSGAHFSSWLKTVENPDVIKLSDELIMSAVEYAKDDYPEQWLQDNVSIPLTYRFEPGAEKDGVNMRIALSVLPQVDEASCSWFIPARLNELIVACLRSLPKPLRKQLVPIPDTASQLAGMMRPGEGHIKEALIRHLQREYGVLVASKDFSTAALDDLQFCYQVVDESGKEIAVGRDLTALKKRFADAPRPAAKPHEFERSDVETWDFGDLAEYMEIKEGPHLVRRYPALDKRGYRLALTLFSTPEQAKIAHRGGLVELVQRLLKREIKTMKRQLPDWNRTCMALMVSIDRELLTQDLMDAAIAHCFFAEQALPRTESGFNECFESHRSQLFTVASKMAKHVNDSIEHYQVIRSHLSTDNPGLHQVEMYADVSAQLNQLIYPHFLMQTPLSALSHYPRYLLGICKRMVKNDQQPDRDRELRASLQSLVQRWSGLVEVVQGNDELNQVRWMLEELRVSLFAQELGTKQKVSVARIEKILQHFDRY